jgi:hypothetical protein
MRRTVRRIKIMSVVCLVLCGASLLASSLFPIGGTSSASGGGSVTVLSRSFMPNSGAGSSYSTPSGWGQFFVSGSGIASACQGAGFQDLCFFEWPTSTTNYVTAHDVVPTGWVSGNVAAALTFEGSGSGNTVQYEVQVGCLTASGLTYNAAQTFASTPTTGSTNYFVLLNGLTMSGCTGSKPINFEFERADSNGLSFLLQADVFYTIP